MNNRPFKPHDDRLIHTMAATGKTNSEIAKALGRARCSVWKRAKNLGTAIAPRPYWTPEEDARLKAILEESLFRYQVACIMGRSEDAIDARMRRIGLGLPAGIARDEWIAGKRIERLFHCDGCDRRIPSSRFRPEQLARSLQHHDSRSCIQCEAEAAKPLPGPALDLPTVRDSWDEDQPIGGGAR